MNMELASPACALSRTSGTLGLTSRVPFGTAVCPFGTSRRRPSRAELPNERPELFGPPLEACTLLRDEQPATLPGAGREAAEGAVVTNPPNVGTRGTR